MLVVVAFVVVSDEGVIVLESKAPPKEKFRRKIFPNKDDEAEDIIVDCMVYIVASFQADTVKHKDDDVGVWTERSVPVADATSERQGAACPSVGEIFLSLFPLYEKLK